MPCGGRAEGISEKGSWKGERGGVTWLPATATGSWQAESRLGAANGRRRQQPLPLDWKYLSGHSQNKTRAPRVVLSSC